MTILTSKNFQWVGEGIPFQKRGKKIRYESFILGDLKIGIGDFVLVRNDDALDPEDFMSCYVAEVKSLYDTGDKFDPYQAQVQWFSRILELPSYAIKLFKNSGHELEIVKDKRISWHDTIDAETIFQKCKVIFLSSDSDFETAISEVKNHSEVSTPIFFCRYVFTGTSLIEVKNQSKDNAAKISLNNESSTVNNLNFQNGKITVKDVKQEKSRSSNKVQEQYCAIAVGSPTKIPRVLIKRIDDKVLPSRNKNLRIFLADPSVENVEDVADIFLNKLKLEKEDENNFEKKPIIQTLTSQNDNLEKIADNPEFMDYDSCVETSSETSSTPQKLSKEKYSIKLNSKFCKNIFTYNTRNSPKKNGSVTSQSTCTTPTKKPRIASLDDLKLKSFSPKMTDVDILKPAFPRHNHRSLKEKCDNDIAGKNKLKDNDILETNDYPVDDDLEIDLLSLKERRKFANNGTVCSAHKSIKKASTGTRKSHKHIKFENSDSYSTPRKKETADVKESSPNKYAEVKNSDSYSTPKKKRASDMKKSSPNKYAEMENSDSYSTPKNKKALDMKKSSPNKYAEMENSDSYSTPKKIARFADGFEEFRQTRSGRRVKAVNYTEEKNEISLISAVTPTRKLPRYIRSDCLDDSDSDNYAASSNSSDEDDDSVSDFTLLDETSPYKTKHSLKSKSVSKTSNSSTLNTRTPKARKNLMNLSIPERKTPLRTPKNALEESRQRLHVSSVPSSLPCRDEEYSDIYSFVKGCLCAQTGGCMYISGVPGTGKTATVHEVMRNLEEEKELGDIPIFTFVEVNGMWMTDPYQCYVQIFKALTGKSIAPQQAADLLEKRFTERGPKKDAVVLLVDELDRLWTRKQTVMYNIFDWPTKKNSKLVVLAIANTMDLPERMMMNRISSRLGLTRKTFQPYTFKQLQEIIMSRIQELKVFDPDAVQLVARKVAAVSGDARRALDICRFATETIKVSQTAKKGQKILVGMEHVDKALQQMFSSPVISAIRSSSNLSKLFFQCILSEFTRTGLEETTLLKVHRQVISTCRFEGLNPPNSTEISRICTDLATSHLILVDNIRNDLYMKIRLNISADDVTYALTLK